MRRTTLAALALVVPLTACGGEDAPADDDRPFNDADVTFATEMVQHHAQALLMVDLTVERDLSPELADLAERIRTTQAAEIETMVDWLEEWGEEVPATDRDHASAHGDHSEDLAELETLQGTEFEEEWLDLMADHHDDAIDMAEAQVEDGEWPAAVDLAEQIAETQQTEIDEMEQLEDRL